MFTAEQLGENLQKIFKDRGISKSDFARKSGVHLNTLNQIISAKTKNPTIQNLFAIAKTLNCSIDEIVGYKTSNNVEDEPLNKKFLSAAINVLNEDLGSDNTDISLADWYNSLKSIYEGITSATQPNKENVELNIKNSGN